MLRNKRPWLIPLCLAIYTTGMFIWLLPQSTDSNLQKIITVVAAYVIIGILYLLLRKK